MKEKNGEVHLVRGDGTECVRYRNLPLSVAAVAGEDIYGTGLFDRVRVFDSSLEKYILVFPCSIREDGNSSND